MKKLISLLIIAVMVFATFSSAIHISAASGTSLEEDCIESSHPYDNNEDNTWIIHKDGADVVTVTFSPDTETESDYDFIYIYDKNDNLVGQYSGTALASKSVKVRGDTVKIRLTSDDSVSKYGFKVVDVKAKTVTGDYDAINIDDINLAAYATVYSYSGGGGSRTTALTDNSLVTYEVAYRSDESSDGRSKWINISRNNMNIKKIIFVTDEYSYDPGETIITYSNDFVDYGGDIVYPISEQCYIDSDLSNAFCVEFVFDPFYANAINIESFPGKIYEIRIYSEEPTVFSGISDNNISWSFDKTSGTLTVSGNGDIESFENWIAPWSELELIVKKLVISEGISNIGEMAFIGCENVQEVILPNSISCLYDNSFFAPEIIRYNGTTDDWDRVNINLTDFQAVMIGFLSNSYIDCTKSETPKYFNDNDAGDLKWTVDTENYTLTISGFGDMYNRYSTIPYPTVQYSGFPKWMKYRCFIHRIIIKDGVTSVSNYAFYKCDHVESISVPESVMEFSDSALGGCQHINYTVYGNAVYLGNESNPYHVLIKAVNTDINSCEINEKTKVIADGAFKGCSKLQTIIIPENVISIGEDVFVGCDTMQFNRFDNAYYLGNGTEPYYALVTVCDKEITSCIINQNTKIISGGGFYDCNYLESTIIPNSIISIGKKAFYSCGSLECEIKIPNSVNYIGSSAFAYSGITGLEIGNGLEVISSEAFTSCNNLKKFTLGSNTSTICHLAFSLCSIESITIPSKVSIIGYEAFMYCGELKTISLNNGISAIGNGAFQGCFALSDIYYDGAINNWVAIEIGFGNESLTNANIHFSDSVATGKCGESLTWELDSETGALTISGEGEMNQYSYNENSPWYLFKEMIKTINIDPGVTSIGSCAFYWCSNLESISIPESVTSIGTMAFAGCSSLKYNIYDNGKYLGSSTNPYLILVKATEEDITSCDINENTKFIGEEAFSQCASLESIFVPEGVVSIGELAFYSCTALKSVSIPDSIIELCEDVFWECDELDFNLFDNCKYLGNSNNPYLVLYEVTDTSITDCVINENCRIIAGYSFILCDSLKNIIIPKRIDYIGNYAFRYCDSLSDVLYAGTKDEWARINIKKNNESLLNANIHYVDDIFEISNSDITVESGFDLNIFGAELIVEKNAEGANTALIPDEYENDNAVVYDIYLERDGEKVQPSGEVTVKIPVPEGMNGEDCKVFWISDDEAVDMNAEYIDGYLVFTTDHFSYYAVVEQIKTDILIGDADGSGSLNMKDLLLLRKVVAGADELDMRFFANADLDGSGDLNMKDVLKLRKILAGEE